MLKQILRKQAVDLTELAIGIITLGIAVTIGIIVLLGVRDSRLTDLSVVTTNNETTHPTAAGNYTLNQTWGIGVSLVTNSTDTTTIASGNYTVQVSGVDGSIRIVNASDYLGEVAANVTYTWYNTSSNADWGLADDAATGLAEYGNWFNVIVIVGIAAVVLSLIFLAFGRREGGAGGTY